MNSASHPGISALTWLPLLAPPREARDTIAAAIVGEGGYSPSGSTPSGVPADVPTPHWFVRLLSWLGFNARSQLDGDVKQQMGGHRYTVLNDRFPLHS